LIVTGARELAAMQPEDLLHYHSAAFCHELEFTSWLMLLQVLKMHAVTHYSLVEASTLKNWALQTAKARERLMKRASTVFVSGTMYNLHS
jgi:Rad3-related DNA helicase